MQLEDHGEIIAFIPAAAALASEHEPADYVIELDAIRRVVDGARDIVNELEDEDMRRRVLFQSTDMMRRNLI